MKLRKTRGAGGDLVDPDAGAPDDDAMTELRERMMQEELKQRKQTMTRNSWKDTRLSWTPNSPVTHRLDTTYLIPYLLGALHE